MAPKKKCKFCGEFGHYPYRCRLNPKTKKWIKPIGRRGLAYNEWRDNVAIPHLTTKYGRKCALCGSTGKLDVDHIAKRRMGGAPSRTMNIDNVRFLCRDCHIQVT